MPPEEEKTEVDMQPQEVLDLFQSYKEQRDWDLRDKDKVNEKKEAKETFEGFLEHIAATQFERLAKMN